MGFTYATQLFQQTALALQIDPTQRIDSTIIELVRLRDPMSSEYINLLADQTPFAQQAIVRQGQNPAPFTMLYVDDNKDLLDMTACVLEMEFEERLSVITSPHSVDAILLAITHRPDLIFSDTLRPAIGGIEVFHFLRSNRRTADIPFVFITPRYPKELQQAINSTPSSARPPEGYLTKPVYPEEVIAVVEKFVAAKEATAPPWGS